MEKKIIDFLNLAENLKSTLRHNWTKTGRQESVAEHTWRLSLFFIIAKDLFKFDVDFERAIKMIIIHDIAEALDVDVPGFIKEKMGNNNYQRIEIKNAKKIFNKLPEPFNKEYINLFLEYEAKETNEARLVQVLDKVETQLQHLNSGPNYWSKEEIGEHMLNYPEKHLKKLNNKNMDKIWEIIKREIKKINKELGVDNS